ncbi:MAG: hypothetical protein WA133_02160 [Syntrophales bacterium]
MNFRRRSHPYQPKSQVIEDVSDDRRIFDETDDSHGSLTFWADQGIYFVYFLNQPGPTFPESLYVSLRFEDAGDSVIQTFLSAFSPRDIAVVSVVYLTICSPRFGMCEQIAASHSSAGKFLVVAPSLAV